MQPVERYYEQAPPVVQDVPYAAMPYQPRGYRSIRDWASSEGLNHQPIFRGLEYPGFGYPQV